MIISAKDSLNNLVGEFQGHGETHPTPWGPHGKATGHWEFRWDPTGHHLLHDYSETRDNGFQFHGHGVLTVDPATGNIVWFWFDTYGFPPLTPATGNFVNGELRLEKVTPRGTGTTLFKVDGDELTVEISMVLAGTDTVMPVSTMEFRRRM